MAKVTQVSLVDDLDGSQASGTVGFALDGKAYELDLSEANAHRLRDALAPFLASARKIGGVQPTPDGLRDQGLLRFSASPGCLNSVQFVVCLAITLNILIY